jgi:hypothetical protein
MKLGQYKERKNKRALHHKAQACYRYVKTAQNSKSSRKKLRADSREEGVIGGGGGGGSRVAFMRLTEITEGQATGLTSET